MGKKTTEQKRAYHKLYYQKNMKRLRQIARIRYWSLHYGKKPPNLTKETVREPKKPKPGLNIKKGEFILKFD